MKAAFIMRRGGQHEFALQLAQSAPKGAKGPYKFGVPARRCHGKTHPEFDVVDYIFTPHWEDPASHFHRWPRAGTEDGLSNIG